MDGEKFGNRRPFAYLCGKLKPTQKQTINLNNETQNL